MSLYHGARTKIKQGSELSEQFLVQGGAHQGSVLSPLLFAITVDVIMENAREGLMKEILHADDVALNDCCSIIKVRQIMRDCVAIE